VFPLALVIVLVVLLAIIVLIILLIRYAWRPGPGPVAQVATAPVITCDVSAELAVLGGTSPLLARTVGPATTGGTIVGQTISVPAGSSISLAADLTLIAAGDIVIDGAIILPGGNAAASGRSARLTVVSRDGEVRIGPGAVISGGGPVPLPGRGAPSPDVRAVGRHPAAASQPGDNGALIKLRGITVVIAGTILGNEGADAGSADADARPAIGSGSARAVGGQGGVGGSILICSEEMITVAATATLFAGDGGTGGLGRQRAAVREVRAAESARRSQRRRPHCEPGRATARLRAADGAYRAERNPGARTHQSLSSHCRSVMPPEPAGRPMDQR